MAQKFKDKELSFFAKTFAKHVAKILLHFNIKFRHFTNHLRKEYILAAKELHPNYNNVQLGIRTGIDRRVVGEYVKDPQKEIPNEHEKDLIVMQRIYEYCEKNKNKKIPHSTFKQISTYTAGSVSSSDAIAIELIRRGWLKEEDNSYLLVNGVDLNSAESKQRVIRSFLSCTYSLVRLLESGQLYNSSRRVSDPIIPIHDLKHLERIHPALYGAILSVQEYTLERFNHILSGDGYEQSLDGEKRKA